MGDMEYKENTTGWWFSQLKEPLKSRSIESVAKAERFCYKGWADEFLSKPAARIEDAMLYMTQTLQGGVWRGAYDYFNQSAVVVEFITPEWQEGYNLARECAPDPIPSDDLEGYLLHIGADAVPPLEVEATRYVPGVTGGLIGPKRQHSPRCTTESEKQAEHNLRIAELEAEQEKTKRELMALNMAVAGLIEQWAEWIKENTYEYPA